MKTSKKLTLFLFVLVALACFVQAGYAQNSISGTVRYSDNNDLVTTGVVKAYDLNGIQVGQAGIQSNGTYLLSGLPCIYIDAIGFPNVEPEEDNFTPTFYPDQINPQYAVTVLACGVITGIDIYVERIGGGNAPLGIASVSGKIQLGGMPIKDAVVYVQVGVGISSFGVSSDDGSYEINNLPEGDYTLVVHRIGYASANAQIHIKANGREYLNFEMAALKHEIAEHKSLYPEKFDLSQNYPNPFNPSTFISYSLPVSGNVKLSVYNSAGQLVKTSGRYSITFDAANLSSGIYFYKLESGSYVQTKRMTLIK